MPSSPVVLRIALYKLSSYGVSPISNTIFGTRKKKRWGARRFSSAPVRLAWLVIFSPDFAISFDRLNRRYRNQRSPSDFDDGQLTKTRPAANGFGVPAPSSRKFRRREERVLMILIIFNRLHASPIA